MPDVRKRKRCLRDLQVAKQTQKSDTTAQDCTGGQVSKQRKLRGEEGKQKKGPQKKKKVWESQGRRRKVKIVVANGQSVSAES